MGRVILISLIVLLLPICCHSRSYDGIAGKVLDAKTGEPVAGAFVSAYKDSKVVGYSISEADGAFQLNYRGAEAPDILMVTMMGYASCRIEVASATEPLEIKLIPQKTELPAAKVSASAIEEKGDTTVFSAAAFSDGQERDIGELLEKLPGISVNESGGIRVDGESIVKFYVEGMDLMGARYGTVVRNLTPDKISRVEVYRHHQPVKALSGMVLTDRSAVNIILKESSRSTWLFSGSASAGAPMFPLFDARAMVTRFAPTDQSLFLLKGNNVGKDIVQELREQEYFGRTSGKAYLLKESIDPDFDSPLSPTLSALDLPKEYWYANTSGIASLNALHKFNNGMMSRTFLNAAAEKYTEESFSSETISFQDGGALTIDEGVSMQDRKLYFNAGAELENNGDKKYFSDKLEFSGQIRDNLLYVSREDPVSDNRNLPVFKIENLLNSTFLTSRHHAVEVMSDTQYFKLDGHRADFTVGTESFSQKYDLSRLDSRNSLRFNVKSRSQIFRIALNADFSYSGLESSLDGLPESYFSRHSKTGIMHFAPGVAVSTTRQIGRSRASVSLPASLNYLHFGGENVVFPLVSPLISLAGPVSGKLDYDVMMSYSMSRSSDESLLGAAVARSYRSLVIPDSLRMTRALIVNSNLKFSDNVAMFYATLSANYGKTSSDRTASSYYFDRYMVASFIPAQTVGRNVGVRGSVKKFFGSRTLVAEARGAAFTSSYEYLLQGRDAVFKDLDYSAGLTLRSNPCDWLSGEIKADALRHFTYSSATTRTDKVTCVFSLAVKPLKDVSLNTDCFWNWYSVEGVKVSNTPLISSELSWKQPKFSVFFRCMNIIDATEMRTEIVNAFQSFHISRNLLGRRILAGIRMSM